MKTITVFLSLILSFSFSSQLLAQMNCPDVGLGEACEKNEANRRRYRKHINHVEKYLNNPRYVFASVNRDPGESINDYRNRVKGLNEGIKTPTSGRHIDIVSSYFDTWTNKGYIMLTADDLHYWLSEKIGYGNQRVDRLVRKAHGITQDLRNNNFYGPMGNITKWKRKLRQFDLFSMECCEGRWLNNPDGGDQPGRSIPGGGSVQPKRCKDSVMLLNQCAK